MGCKYEGFWVDVLTLKDDPNRKRDVDDLNHIDYVCKWTGDHPQYTQQEWYELKASEADDNRTSNKATTVILILLAVAIPCIGAAVCVVAYLYYQQVQHSQD